MRRTIPFAVLCAVAALAAGCSSTPSSFYTLSQSTAPAAPPAPLALAVVVGPVSIPAVVDQPIAYVAAGMIEVDVLPRRASPGGAAAALADLCLPEPVQRYYQSARPIELRPVEYDRYLGKKYHDGKFNVWIRASAKLPDDPAFGCDPSPGIVYDGATGTQTEVPSPTGNQQGYYAGIRDALFGKGPVPVPVKDAVACMAILETSFESGSRGQVLPLALTDDERAAWKPFR